jgi:hypothetical protein
VSTSFSIPFPFREHGQSVPILHAPDDCTGGGEEVVRRLGTQKAGPAIGRGADLPPRPIGSAHCEVRSQSPTITALTSLSWLQGG